MKYTPTILFIILTLTLFACNKGVEVGLFVNDEIETSAISIKEGSYLLWADGSFLCNINKGDVILCNLQDDCIRLLKNNTFYGAFKNIDFKKNKKIKDDDDIQYIVGIINIIPRQTTKEYDGELNIYISKGFLQIVNTLEMDKYLAAVAEAEGGPNAPFEFYKVQTIVCRTYTKTHMNKHRDEGFDLCDKVHCQAYNHRVKFRPEIYNAAKLTREQILVDNEGRSINAVFHANCGGRTSSSEIVWGKEQDYLKGVKDEFCVGHFQSSWKKKIALADWKNYLLNNGFDRSSLSQKLDFYQGVRKKYLSYGKDKIPLKLLRRDWNLKSTYFSAEQKGDYLWMWGKGYGHGVGLCQNGAVGMCKAGYNYKEIIHFYYTDVRIVNSSLFNLGYFMSW